MMHPVSFDSIPFKIMRYRYGVPVLLLLGQHDQMYLNEMRKVFGSEYEPIRFALAYLIEHKFVVENESSGGDERIKILYALTAKGRRLAIEIRLAAERLDHVCHENDEPQKHNSR